MKIKVAILVAIFLISSLTAAFLFYGVSVEATIDRNNAKLCPPTHPIKVTVKNHTLKNMRNVLFNMELFKNGKSKILLIHGRNRFNFPQVVNRFESAFNCFGDDYFTQIVSKSAPPAPDSEFVKVNMADAIAEINRLNKMIKTHEIYVSNIEPVFLE